VERLVVLIGRGIRVPVRGVAQHAGLVHADRDDNYCRVRRRTRAMRQRSLTVVHIRPVCATWMISRGRCGQRHQCRRDDPRVLLGGVCRLGFIPRVSPGLERLERGLRHASGRGLAGL
jgi:hypothetical protein